jgi:hypothetical protein
MSHGGIQFVGDWRRCERRIVGLTVSATDDFLGAHMPAPWVFTKGGGGFTVTQPSLLEAEAEAANLVDLLEQIRHAATAASMWVTDGEEPEERGTKRESKTTSLKTSEERIMRHGRDD